MPSPSALADLLPDEPAWIDLGGLLRSGRCDIHCGEDPESGFVACSWDFPFGAVWGSPGEKILRAATREGSARDWSAFGEPWSLLVPGEREEELRGALEGWSGRSITLHSPGPRPPAGPSSPAPPGIEIRVWEEGPRGRIPLEGLPGPLRHELSLDWVDLRPLAAALSGEKLLSVCHACFETEEWWDVGVETLAAQRRLGLASRCFLALERAMRRAGKRPVWGAHDDNAGSLGLAASLGFEPCARLVAFVPPA